MGRWWYIAWGTILILTGVVLNQVKAAEPECWAGTPVFYTDYTPGEVQCYYEKKAFQGSCLITGYPEEGVVGITNVGSEEARAQPMRLYTEVTCDMGHCLTQAGQPAGWIMDNMVQYWTIPVGYYMSDETGIMKAYRHGTGPKKSAFPIRNVKIIQGDKLPAGDYLPEENERLTYNVSCNPGGDCYYMGKEINYAQLNNYVPKRLTTQCDVRFCYDRNQMIAGLNPRTNK